MKSKEKVISYNKFFLFGINACKATPRRRTREQPQPLTHELHDCDLPMFNSQRLPPLAPLPSSMFTCVCLVSLLEAPACALQHLFFLPSLPTLPRGNPIPLLHHSCHPAALPPFHFDSPRNPSLMNAIAFPSLPAPELNISNHHNAEVCPQPDPICQRMEELAHTPLTWLGCPASQRMMWPD